MQKRIKYFSSSIEIDDVATARSRLQVQDALRQTNDHSGKWLPQKGSPSPSFPSLLALQFCSLLLVLVLSQ